MYYNIGRVYVVVGREWRGAYGSPYSIIISSFYFLIKSNVKIFIGSGDRGWEIYI